MRAEVRALSRFFDEAATGHLVVFGYYAEGDTEWYG